MSTPEKLNPTAKSSQAMTSTKSGDWNWIAPANEAAALPQREKQSAEHGEAHQDAGAIGQAIAPRIGPIFASDR